MNIQLFQDYTAVCLYTYETASARDRIITIDNLDYGIVDRFVTKYFGHNRMDNKITLLLKSGSGTKETFVYATYWDGNLAIGTDVMWFADMTKKHNEYRKIYPL